MEINNTIMTIFKRRSIRKYKTKEIPDEIINTLLKAGIWAPSGKNNQPWRFSIIKNDSKKNEIALLTKYSRIIKKSNTCIAVFYNIPSGYNRERDIMSIGACIQNILIAAESLNIGAVWLGEILNRKTEINLILNINDENELMAVIALGFPDETPNKNRNELNSFRLQSYY